MRALVAHIAKKLLALMDLALAHSTAPARKDSVLSSVYQMRPKKDEDGTFATLLTKVPVIKKNPLL